MCQILVDNCIAHILSYQCGKIWPKVFQYNKMDLAEQSCVNALRSELNPMGEVDYESVAPSSIGTIETLDGVVKKVLFQLGG